MQDLFTQVYISDILQFLQECDFYKKFKDFDTITFLIIFILKFYVRRMGR